MSDSLQQSSVSLEPPLRMYHLTGGLSLLVASNRMCTLLSPGGFGLSFFSLLANAPVPFLSSAEGSLRAFGSNYFGAAQEMQEAVASNFAIIAPNVNNTCPAYSQSQHWSGVATTLHGSGRGTDALVATRIFSQIRHCLTRLERLSAAYRTVLSVAEPAERSTISYTSDKYAHYLGSEYRSLLNELYSLRDSLLAGVFRLHYARTEPYTIRRIKSLVCDDQSRIGRLIDNSMFSSN